MAEQALLAELGMRVGVVGSSASLAIAAPTSNTAGSWNPTAMTAANRTGMFFDQTGAAEVIGFMVGGVAGPTWTRSGTVVNEVTTGSITAKSGALVGIALVPQGGAANFTGSITTALLSASRTYTFPDADVAVIGGTVGNTQIAYGAGTALTSDAAFTRVAGGATALVMDSTLDATATFGNACIGFATGGTAGVGYVFQRGIANPQTNYALACNSGTNILNASGSIFLRIANGTRITLINASMTFATGVTLVLSDTTDGTSGTAGAFNTLGGIGVTKAGWFGTNVTLANGLYAQTVTDAITNTFTNLLTLNHASSGTVAASFGTRILFNLTDDAAVNRNAGGIVVNWTSAVSTAQASQMLFQTVTAGGGTVTALTVAPAAVTVPSSSTLVCSNATDGTSGTAGAINTLGGIGVTKAGWFGTNVTVGTSVIFGNTATAYLTANTNPIIYGTSSAGGGYPFLEAGNLIISARISGAARDVIISNGSVADFKFDRSGNQTIAASTASTTAGTGCLILGGGIGVAGAMTITGAVTAAGNVQGNRMQCANGVTTALATGVIGLWRSGGTIGTAGDMVFQTDLGQAAAAFVFRAALTTPATICTLSPGTIAATTPGCTHVATSLIAGAVTDSYTAGIRITPTLSGAFTTTRFNYIDLNNVTLASSAVLTDAAAFRFDAATGTHSALASTGATAITFTAIGPTGAQTTIQGFLKINVNGTLRYIPYW